MRTTNIVQKCEGVRVKRERERVWGTIGWGKNGEEEREGKGEGDIKRDRETQRKRDSRDGKGEGRYEEK